MSTVIDLDRAVRPDLSGRRVVILGGTGSVGEGIVRAWLAAGADVVVPSRTQGRADQFTEVLGEVTDVGVAADERATGVDYVLRTNDQMLEALASLGVHPGAGDAGE